MGKFDRRCGYCNKVLPMNAGRGQIGKFCNNSHKSMDYTRRAREPGRLERLRQKEEARVQRKIDERRDRAIAQAIKRALWEEVLYERAVRRGQALVLRRPGYLRLRPSQKDRPTCPECGVNWQGLFIHVVGGDVAQFTTCRQCQHWWSLDPKERT